MVQVGAAAGELGEGLGPEAHPSAQRFRHRLGHHPEEGVAVGGHQGVREGPVDLELAVGILVIGLIRPPAQLLHRFEQAADQLELAHQRQLVVAGFALGVVDIGDRRARRAAAERTRLPPLCGSCSPAALPVPAGGAAPSAATAPRAGPPPADRWPPRPRSAARAAPPGWRDRVGRAHRDRPGSSPARRRNPRSRRHRGPVGSRHSPAPAWRAALRTDPRRRRGNGGSVVGSVAGQVGHGLSRGGAERRGLVGRIRAA